MRVLVTTIGTGRTGDDIAEAVVFSLGRNKADHAVFLCSEKTRQHTLPRILERLAGWTPDRYQVHVTTAEDDVQSLFVEWNSRWDDWFAGWAGAEAVVDFTSGTKPMSAAAVLLAFSRGARSLSYVTGERDDTGRVVTSTGVLAISPDLVLAHRHLRLAAEHFHAGSFAAARDIAAAYLRRDTMPDERLREVARSVAFIGEAYALWDRFDYKAAAAKLRESERYRPQWPWVDDVDRLAANHDVMTAVRDAAGRGEFSPALAADLIANARRCLDRQRWDDAVARLYRACELLAQLVLLRDFRQQTSNIDPDRLTLPAEVLEEYRQRKARSPDGRLKLGLNEAYTLLERLGSPAGREFRARYGTEERPGELKGLLGSRNSSLLAHGMDPIREDKARKLMEHVTVLARVVDPAIVETWAARAELVRFRPF